MKKLPRRVQPTGLETVSVSAVRNGVARQTVIRAITDGRLPAYSAETNADHPIFLVKPSDADALWATRKKPLVVDPELIFA